MKLSLIKEELEKYKRYLQGQLENDQNYKWEILNNFELNWNLEEQDIKAMFSRCLQSDASRNLWGGEKESAKSVLLKMMDVNPEFVRLMFRDLLNDNKELLLRLDRFGYHCDQLMPEVEKQFGKQIEHYHHKPRILATYLSFIKPKEYCLFDYPAFAEFAKRIAIQNIPEEYAILRFFKIMKSLYIVISKDEELKELQKKRLAKPNYSNSNTLLLCHDFYYMVGSQNHSI